MIMSCSLVRYSVLRDLLSSVGHLANAVGADGGEGPPVPIPNTVVKLVCVDNTWRATAREDR